MLTVSKNAKTYLNTQYADIFLLQGEIVYDLPKPLLGQYLFLGRGRAGRCRPDAVENGHGLVRSGALRVGAEGPGETISL